MTVQEAGRRGGIIGGRKGGQTVLRERGPQFYSEIGKKGGQRVRELIAMAKEAEAAAGKTPKRTKASTPKKSSSSTTSSRRKTSTTGSRSSTSSRKKATAR